jgi:hypothetical protein
MLRHTELHGMQLLEAMCLHKKRDLHVVSLKQREFVTSNDKALLS